MTDTPYSSERLNSLLNSAQPGMSSTLSPILQQVSDPETVTVRLATFLESCSDRSAQESLLADSPDYATLLCTVLDHSQYLADTLSGHPEYLESLWDDGTLTVAKSRAQLDQDLGLLFGTEETFTAQCESMRVFFRREMLRIAVMDIFAHAEVVEVTQALSDLADALLERTLAGVRAELVERHGRPMAESSEDAATEATFVVLAMGKLGGMELNFSSDIDLVFLYSDEGETAGGTGHAITNFEFFTKLGEGLLNVFTTQTPSGQLFRVDMRLRPHGRKGPLVMSISSTLLYYEIQGYAWERQALIKARPAAGDAELGQSFIEQARPFVFPRYFDDATLEEIRVGKQRLEAQVAEAGHTEREVKLGRGGIRDIEFTVQMLQLLNGGRIPELRTRKSLEAIELLGRHDLLRGFEALALTRNYIFLRRIEHRLQIEGGRQIHVLPDNPEELQRFAHRFGFASADAFMREYRMRSRETRSILDRFFAEKGSGNLWIVELLDSEEHPDAAVEQLKRMGFSDPKRARRELIALHEGDPDRPHSAHTRQRFREIAPALLEALAATPNPDATLMRLERMLMSLRAPGTIYDILKHVPELSESLATLISNSPYLADFIIQDPGLFETFGYSGALDQETTDETLEKSLTLLRSARDSDAALYRLRRAETLRIGMRDLLRDTDIVTVGHELSRLADLCVREALLQAQQKTAERFGPSNVDFAVLALGKLGGSELSYASDLDLVFIHEGEDDPQRDVGPAEYCATLASHLIRIIKEPTSYGALYEIDTRLRPDGRRGPLSVSRARFESYFRDEAQAWERLALVKVRGIAGTGTFAARAEQFARDCAFSCPLSSEDLHRIEEVRKRLAAQSSPLDLKRREGGIAEIEFAIRMLQIAHAADHPELKRGDALGALDLLESAGLVSENEHATLREAYLFLRRVENRVRMMKGRAESTLPSDANALRELGELLGIPGDLRAQVDTYASAVHCVYEAVFQRLPNPG